MVRYTVVIVDQSRYDALPIRTQKLFNEDTPKLERDPYNPPGLNSKAIDGRRDYREATVARGAVIITYTVRHDTVQVRILEIIKPRWCGTCGFVHLAGPASGTASGKGLRCVGRPA